MSDHHTNCGDCPLARTPEHDATGMACGLRHGGRDYGVLVVALPKEMTGEPGERALFEEVAGDIGYALFVIEQEAQRRTAEAELVRTDEALRRSQETLRAVFESASDGIAVAGSEDGRLVMANAAFCRMLGCTPEDVPNLSVTDLHSPDHVEEVKQIFSELATGQRSRAEAIPVLRRDGTSFRADVASAQLKLDGRPCVVGIFRDITQRLALEGQLRQAQKMEAVGRLADRVRTQRPDIKTLFMSGYTANIILGQGVLEEGADFLQKPVDMATMCIKIRSMLDAAPTRK